MITPPRYLFGFSNSANMYQHMLRQIMELRLGYGEHSGKKETRVDDVIYPAEDEF